MHFPFLAFDPIIEVGTREVLCRTEPRRSIVSIELVRPQNNRETIKGL